MVVCCKGTLDQELVSEEALSGTFHSTLSVLQLSVYSLDRTGTQNLNKVVLVNQFQQLPLVGETSPLAQKVQEGASSSCSSVPLQHATIMS